MSLMPSGIPSIGDNGRPARQRSADRSAAERAAAMSLADKRTDSRFEFLDAGETALKQIARRVLAGPKIGFGGDERDGLRCCHGDIPVRPR
jgi:hypothetical protein